MTRLSSEHAPPHSTDQLQLQLQQHYSRAKLPDHHHSNNHARHSSLSYRSSHLSSHQSNNQSKIQSNYQSNNQPSHQSSTSKHANDYSPVRPGLGCCGPARGPNQKHMPPVAALRRFYAPLRTLLAMLRLPLIFRLPSKLRRRARRNRAMLLIILLGLLILPALLCLLVVYRPPTLLIRYMMHRFPTVLWHVDTSRNLIALTIDDAPSQHTPEILHILATNNAHATFFVIGSQAETPDRQASLREIVRAGNELGNHAWRDEASVELTDKKLGREIAAVRGQIRRAYAAEDRLPPPNYFRPGGGFFSQRMRAVADKLGYRIVLGDVYPHDPQIPWPRLNAWHILSMVTRGSIVVCHDRRPWTVPMLAKVLPALKRRGYEVVTLSTLLAAQALEEREREEQRRTGLDRGVPVLAE